MNEIVIDIAPTGRVQGMHRDEFNLGFLGPQKIERASEIKFDEDTQQWQVWLPARQYLGMLPETKVSDGYALVAECGSFDSYNGARDFEVLWMNECRKASLSPGSAEARRLATTLRSFLSSGSAATT